MKALFIFLFLFLICQEKPKQDTVKADTASIETRYKVLNMKLDSIIATKNAEKRYNLNDTCK